MYISSGVSNTCLFAPAPYYKLNKGFSLSFLFKTLGGLRPPCGLNKKASEEYPLFITKWPFFQKSILQERYMLTELTTS